MTEVRKITLEGVPFVIVTPDELHPTNQRMRDDVRKSVAESNRKAAARRIARKAEGR